MTPPTAPPPLSPHRGSASKLGAEALADAASPFVIEHREALIYMLCQAAELARADRRSALTRERNGVSFQGPPGPQPIVIVTGVVIVPTMQSIHGPVLGSPRTLQPEPGSPAGLIEKSGE